MRESIGGTMLFWIVLFFLSIFITFMASIIKYARVYKIKNSLINYIERQEGVENVGEVEDVLYNYGYKYDKFIICKYNPTERGGYYYVELYAIFEVPIVGWTFDLGISGETRTIVTGTKIKEDFIGKGC